VIKVPKVKLKKFRKFKSDTLWEKENANYESLDSDDSLDIQTKIKKPVFQRARDLDRMDLTESNIKKKEQIKKELHKTYMKVESYGSSQVRRPENEKGPKDIKINLFEDSQVYRIGSSNDKQRQEKLKEVNRLMEKEVKQGMVQQKKEPVKFSIEKARSVHDPSELTTSDFLPKKMNERRLEHLRKQKSQSVEKKNQNKAKNLNTQKAMMNIKKRFETEDDFEEFRFY
jgi:hypothetical protein